MLRNVLILCFWSLYMLVAYANSTPDLPQNRNISICYTPANLTIDGIPSEPDWEMAFSATDFVQHFPYDTSLGQTRTTVKLLFNDRFLYVLAICHDEQPGSYVVQSLKRDFSYPKSDAFVIYLDPQDDKTNGFSFGVNPYGAQREGLLANGGAFGVTTVWDNRWFSAVTQNDTGWIAEIAIPLKTIRYDKTKGEWGINFSRHNLKLNENTAWSRVPREYNVASLAFTGRLFWEQPPPAPGANISLIPYAIGGLTRDYAGQRPAGYRANAGLDAKVAITPSLNLDLTLNPDFSQVEVDRQIINLDRFDIFFPEQRQFFIENSDLFAGFGFSRIRPFFSRRIGLQAGSVIPILGGFRLSGNVHKNWRIAAMSMQTEGVREAKAKSQNFGAAAFQWRAFGNSNFGGILVNRQAFDDFKLNRNDYNRIIGGDFNIASKNNRLRGKLFYHQSFSPEKKKDAAANASWLQYQTRRVFAMWNHEYVGENYRADVGFVPRKGFWRLEPMFSYLFYPDNRPIIQHGPHIYLNLYLDQQFKWTDQLVRLNYFLEFRNKSQVNVFVRENYIYLFFPFDPTGLSKTPLPVDTDYRYRNFGAEYISDFRRKFSFTLSGEYGSYFNGTRLLLKGEVIYRHQPYGSISLYGERNELRMPSPFQSAYLNLIGSRVDISFTQNLFFTTFVQYNSQVKNMNINTRFQWRFRPMSDIFLVYTDNYLTESGQHPTFDFVVKNRAVVLKFVWWISI